MPLSDNIISVERQLMSTGQEWWYFEALGYFWTIFAKALGAYKVVGISRKANKRKTCSSDG
jgi:hypothetical protein